MAAEKISALTALGAAPATNDLLVLVDVSDLSMALTGTTKKMTVANLIAGLGAATGSGTVNRLAMWTASTVLGDSIVEYAGNEVRPVSANKNLGGTAAANRWEDFFINGKMFTYDSPFVIDNNGIEIIYLSGGNVGIKNSAPSSDLTIGDLTSPITLSIESSLLTGNILQLSTTVATAGSLFRVRNASGSAHFVETTHTSTEWAIGTTGVSGIKLKIRGSSSSSSSASLDISDSGGTTWLYAQDNRRLNIGAIDNTATLFVQGIGTGTALNLKIQNSISQRFLTIADNGVTYMENMQTGNAGLATGGVYKDTAANILANGDYHLAIKA